MNIKYRRKSACLSGCGLIAVGLVVLFELSMPPRLDRVLQPIYRLPPPPPDTHYLYCWTSEDRCLIYAALPSADMSTEWRYDLSRHHKTSIAGVSDQEHDEFVLTTGRSTRSLILHQIDVSVVRENRPNKYSPINPALLLAPLRRRLPDVEVVDYAFSPDKHRIAWILKPQISFPFMAWIRRIFPGLKLKRPLSLWITDADCHQMKEIGVVDTWPETNEDCDEFLQWMPEGKKVSFIYHGAICTISASE